MEQGVRLGGNFAGEWLLPVSKAINGSIKFMLTARLRFLTWHQRKGINRHHDNVLLVTFRFSDKKYISSA